MSDDLVSKCEDGYELTARGRSYADKLDPDTLDIAWGAKPRSVIFIALHNAAGQWLLVRRDRQPTINRVGFIATDVSLGETIQETAARYLEAAYSIETKLAYQFSGSVTLYRHDGLESYCVFQLLIGQLETAPETPGLQWYDTSQLGDPDILPSTFPLIGLLTGHQAPHDFAELVYTLQSKTNSEAH